MPKIKDLADRINKLVADGHGDEMIAADLYRRGDVHSRVAELGMDEITDESADEILETMHKKLDSEYGFNIGVLSNHIEDAIDDIREREREDAEVQDEKDHKNGLYGEEY